MSSTDKLPPTRTLPEVCNAPGEDVETPTPSPPLKYPLMAESAPSDAVCAKRLVEEAMVAKKVDDVALAKVLLPEKVLSFASNVEEAAVIVILVVPSKSVPLMFLPVWSAVAVEALPVRAPTNVVNHAVVPERSVVEALENWLRPVQLFAFERSVEDAAVIVMSAVPLKSVPLIFRPVWSAVAVPALPLIEPVTVELNVLLPLKVLLLARSVEDAAVTVTDPPAVTAVPFTVARVPVKRLVPIEDEATT